MLRRTINFLLIVWLLLVAAWLVIRWGWLDAWNPHEQLHDALLIAFGMLYPILTVVAIYAVIRDGSRPSKVIAWILVLVALPVVGIILYSFLGKNLRKERQFSRKQAHDVQVLDDLVKQQLVRFDQAETNHSPIVHDYRRLAHLQLRSGKFLLLPGNRAQVLQDGEETFKAIFAALEQAQNFIHIEYYIFEEGELADRIAAILTEKVQQGVKARLVYDGVGSWSLSKAYCQRLKEAGVEVFPFMPVRFGPLANRLNYRNHRKIVVVDGRIGFTGGINVSDKYIKGDPKLGHWRDTHLQLEGRAVNFLQYVFLTDWQFVSGQNLLKEEHFPEYEPAGNTPVQISASGPDSTYASIHQAYVSMLYSAQQYVYLANAYLIPDDSLLLALKSTALSGVDVRLMIPEASDSFIVKWSSRSYLEELMVAGVKVYFYQKGFLHSKVMVVDDALASVGTANLDIRSFEQNFEINALMYDEGIARQLKARFKTDMQDCRLLDLDTYRQRPQLDKIKESVFRLVSPVL